MIVAPQPAAPSNTAIPKATVAALGASPAEGAALPFAELLGITPQAGTAKPEPEKPTDPAKAHIASGEEPTEDTQDILAPSGMTLQKPTFPKAEQAPGLTMSVAQKPGGEYPAAHRDELAQEGAVATEVALPLQVATTARSGVPLGTPTNDAAMLPAEAVVTATLGAGSPSRPVDSATQTAAAPTGVSAATSATDPAGSAPSLVDVAEPLATTQLPASRPSGFERAAAPTEASVSMRALPQLDEPERALSPTQVEASTRSQSVNSNPALAMEAASVTVAKQSVPGPDAPQLRTLAAVLGPTTLADPEAPAPVPPTSTNQQQPLVADPNNAIVMDASTSQAEPLARPSGEAVVTAVAPTMSVRVDAPQAPVLAASPAQPVEVATPLPSTMVGRIQEMQQAGQTQSRIVIRLDPPELGTVRLELVKIGEDVLIVARAETAEAARALLRQQPEIRSAVEALGLSLSQFDVETPNQQEARHRFGQASRSRTGLAEPESDTAGSEADPAPEQHNEGAIFL